MEIRTDQTITVLVRNNPKKEGTAARHMFGQYKPGDTVGEYDARIRATADERVHMGLQPRADQGRRAIKWDLKHKYIRID
jgi:hypothetical protein